MTWQLDELHLGPAAQQHRLEGDTLINGQPLRPQATIQTGDVLETGPKSRLIFVIGNSSFHVRQNSRMALDEAVRSTP